MLKLVILSMQNFGFSGQDTSQDQTFYPNITQVQVSEEQIVKIDASQNSVFVQLNNGSLLAKGNSNFQQLGTDVEEQLFYLQVPFCFTNQVVKDFSLSETHSLVLTSDNIIYSQGLNTCFQLGRSGQSACQQVNIFGIGEEQLLINQVVVINQTSFVTTASFIFFFGQCQNNICGFDANNNTIQLTQTIRKASLPPSVQLIKYAAKTDCGLIYQDQDDYFHLLGNFCTQSLCTSQSQDNKISPIQSVYASISKYTSFTITENGSIFFCGQDILQAMQTFYQTPFNLRTPGCNVSQIVTNNQNNTAMSSDCGVFVIGTSVNGSLGLFNQSAVSWQLIYSGTEYDTICLTQNSVYLYNSGRSYYQPEEQIPQNLTGIILAAPYSLVVIMLVLVVIICKVKKVEEEKVQREVENSSDDQQQQNLDEEPNQEEGESKKDESEKEEKKQEEKE